MMQSKTFKPISLSQVHDKEKYVRIFENEFLPHIDALHTFAYHLTYNEDDASNLVQET